MTQLFLKRKCTLKRNRFLKEAIHWQESVPTMIVKVLQSPPTSHKKKLGVQYASKQFALSVQKKFTQG